MGKETELFVAGVNLGGPESTCMICPFQQRTFLPSLGEFVAHPCIRERCAAFYCHRPADGGGLCMAGSRDFVIPAPKAGGQS